MTVEYYPPLEAGGVVFRAPWSRAGLLAGMDRLVLFRLGYENPDDLIRDLAPAFLR